MKTLSSSNTAPLATSEQTLSVRTKNDESLDHMKYVEQQLTSTPKILAEEKLSISEQALAMFRQDSTKTQGNEKSTQDNTNDKLLEKIKEQIETVKRQLSRIKNDKGEAVEQQRRQLQLQLATLNATMLDLLGKKLDAI